LRPVQIRYGAIYLTYGADLSRAATSSLGVAAPAAPIPPWGARDARKARRKPGFIGPLRD